MYMFKFRCWSLRRKNNQTRYLQQGGKGVHSLAPKLQSAQITIPQVLIPRTRKPKWDQGSLVFWGFRKLMGWEIYSINKNMHRAILHNHTTYQSHWLFKLSRKWKKINHTSKTKKSGEKCQQCSKRKTMWRVRKNCWRGMLAVRQQDTEHPPTSPSGSSAPNILSSLPPKYYRISPCSPRSCSSEDCTGQTRGEKVTTEQNLHWQYAEHSTSTTHSEVFQDATNI